MRRATAELESMVMGALAGGGSCRPLRRGLVLCCAAAAVTAAEPELQRLERLAGEVLALQQAAAEAEASWLEQRPAVQGRIEVLRQQVAAGEARLRDAEQAAADAAAARRAAEAEAQGAREGLAALAAPMAKAEESLRALLPRLPGPLAEALRERVREMPDPGREPGPESAAERLRLIVGILTEIDQFANGVHLVRQPLEDPGQVPREMEVLYLGLAAAFAVSPDDSAAAVARPGPDGWVWRWDASLAGPVRSAVAIYRKEQPAAFVTLPLELTPDRGGGAP